MPVKDFILLEVYLLVPLASEATSRGVLYKMVLLEISQNSQENTCARTSFLIKLQASSLTPCLQNTSERLRLYFRQKNHLPANYVNHTTHIHWMEIRFKEKRKKTLKANIMT